MTPPKTRARVAHSSLDEVILSDHRERRIPVRRTAEVSPKDFIKSPGGAEWGQFYGMLRYAQHDTPSYVTSFGTLH
jgi:hypothetical protein